MREKIKIKKKDKANIELKKRNRELKNKIKLQEKEIKKQTRLANFDYLTQVSNRASFTRSLEDMIFDFKNKDYPFILLYIDLDNFKRINDKYTHAEGDKVLLRVAQQLVLDNRAQTLIGRLGGEEFGIVLPGANREEGNAAANRLLESIRNIRFNIKDIKMTASIGMYSPNKEDTLEDIVYFADKAMYFSKNNGKDKLTDYKDI